MVERVDRAPVGTFYAPGVWRDEVELDEAAAHHAAVKRLAVGDMVRLSSGDGRRAWGKIAAIEKRRLAIAVHMASVESVPASPPVELWAPVADRERTLMLAEKSVELGVSSWTSVSYRRSRSVTQRGEGDAFQEKIRLRQISALEQSASAWLPDLRAQTSLEKALSSAAAAPSGSRLLLDADGESLSAVVGLLDVPIRIALGPEGGLEESERAQFIRTGWRAVSLGINVLRFETAGIAALAIVRSHFA